jgi:hypothetical protein
MRRSGGFQPPVRSVLIVRPGDKFSIAGIAATFLKIGAANLLVRAVMVVGAVLALVILLGVMSLFR